MRYRYTLITSVFLIILGLGAYFTHLQIQESLTPPPPLFPFVKDDFSRITKVIVWGKGDTAVCERTKSLGWWYFTNSGQGKVDSRKIQSILNEMTAISKKTPLVENAADLAQFGLNKEKIAAEVWFNEKPYKLIIGAKDISRENHFARLADSNDVFLIKNSLYKLVNKGQIELADMRVFGVDADEIEAVGFSDLENEFELIMKNGQFRLAKPQVVIIEAKDATNLFQRFQDLQMHMIKRNSDQKDIDLDKPELIFSLKTKGQLINLGLTTKNDEIYHGRRNTDKQIVEFRKGTIRSLISAFTDLLAEETAQEPKETEVTEKG